MPPLAHSYLQILDTKNGHIISSIANADNIFYTYPKFYKENKIISAIRNQSGQMSLAQININTGHTEYLLPFSFNVIGFPCIWRDTIYFSASHDNDDQLYAYSIEHKKLLTLETPLFKEALGYYQPAVSDAEIAWITFTATGFKLVGKRTKLLLPGRLRITLILRIALIILALPLT